MFRQSPVCFFGHIHNHYFCRCAAAALCVHLSTKAHCYGLIFLCNVKQCHQCYIIFFPQPWNSNHFQMPSTQCIFQYLNIINMRLETTSVEGRPRLKLEAADTGSLAFKVKMVHSWWISLIPHLMFVGPPGPVSNGANPNESSFSALLWKQTLAYPEHWVGLDHNPTREAREEKEKEKTETDQIKMIYHNVNYEFKLKVFITYGPRNMTFLLFACKEKVHPWFQTRLKSL